MQQLHLRNHDQLSFLSLGRFLGGWGPFSLGVEVLLAGELGALPVGMGYEIASDAPREARGAYGIAASTPRLPGHAYISKANAESSPRQPATPNNM